MKAYYLRAKSLALSSTAVDTYVLFGGNVLSAFLGFVYTLFIARALSVSEFGIFSAAVNLVIILTSLSDLGLSTGVTNFVAEKEAQNDTQLVNKFIKAGIITRLAATILIVSPMFLFPHLIAEKLLAGGGFAVANWTSLVTLSLSMPMLLPFILQAKKKFFQSVVSDNALYLSRLLFLFFFLYLFTVTIDTSMLVYVLGGLVGTIVCFFYIGNGFLRVKADPEIYKKLFRFSGWLGVNRIISSISGRLDIQMLAILAGASATGLYSIPSRLAGFVVVLTSSFSGVLAPRFAGFQNKEKEKKYLVKATLALIPIIAGLILWIVIARPFILILFGDKYLDAVPIFQALTASMIPFVLTAPSVTAIIYSMKKTVFIGAYSFFQLVAIFILNLVFIPKYGPIGPTLTFGITNIILAIYTWYIVINHYWFKKT